MPELSASSGRLGCMHRIATVDHTNDVPDEVLAQAVGGAAAWHRDDRGAVYDQDEIYVAASLTEAAVAMRDLGWFTSEESHLSGVNWRRIDAVTAKTYGRNGNEPAPSKYWAEQVRAAVRSSRRD